MNETPEKTTEPEKGIKALAAEPKREPTPAHERVIARPQVQDRILRGYQARTFTVVRGWAGVPTGTVIGVGTRRPAPRGQRLINLLREGWIEPMKRRGRPRKLA